jgi:uncharacterized protein
MKIRVEDILEEGLEIALAGDEDVLSDAIAKIPAQRRIQIDPRVKGHLHVSQCGQEIILSGSIETTFSLQCSRCLAEFDLPVRVDPHVVIRRPDADNFDEAADGADEEVYAFFIEGEEIDPGDVLIQELLLELPMKPLCHEDCPGLCVQCGAPKGSAECTCEVARPVDPRWEALAKLKDGLNP